MNNYIENFYSLNPAEFISYFSPEIFYIIAFCLNVLLFFVIKEKTKQNKFSNFITTVAFILSGFTTSLIYFKNFYGLNFAFGVFKDNVFLEDTSIFLKIIISLFFLLYITLFNRLIKRQTDKIAFLNTIMLLIAALSNFIVQFNNYLLAFIFLDMVVFLIFLYLKNVKIQKSNSILKPVIISVFSSFVFYFANILKFSDNNIMPAIINLLIIMAFLFKVGIFPVYNYISVNEDKNNIFYNMFFAAYLPFVAIIQFAKLYSSIFLNDYMLLMVVLIFLFSSILTSCSIAIRTKNAVKFFSNYMLIEFGFLVAGYIFSQNAYNTVKLGLLYFVINFMMFVLFLIFNLNGVKKITFSAFCGMSILNRLNSSVFAFVLLIMFSVFPSKIMKASFEMLTDIYSFDLMGFVVAFMFVLVNMLCFVKAIRIIYNSYSPDIVLAKKFKKRTTLNYVILFLLIVFVIFV